MIKGKEGDDVVSLEVREVGLRFGLDGVESNLEI